MSDEDYLSSPCISCRSLYGEDHTNYDCIVLVAQTTGTPLDIALKDFRPPVGTKTEATVWSHYVQQYKYENGEVE